MRFGNRIRVRRLAVLAVLAAALAGCGSSGPPLAPSVATRLVKQADATAARAGAGDPCGASAHAQALQRAAIDAINAGRVPQRYQETLLSRVNELVSELGPRCLPTPSPAPVSAPAAPAPAPPAHGGKDHARDKHDHGHGKDHRK